MENEAEASSGTGGSGSTSRPPVSQMSLYERQAVQALQALHRQPNAAAQYLQQMYAAQHQQLILQQHLSSAQLQNLAAVHQVTLAANRQVTSGSGGETQSGGTAQSTVNLSTSPATQGGVRPHTASSPVTSVLLNPTGTSSLSPTQAKMYLQAQVVARTLTRTAPLTHQLILMPGGSVTAVQTDGSSTGAGTHCESEAQNLAVRGQPSSATKPLPLSLNQPIPGPTAHPSAGPGQPLPSAKVGPIPHGEGEAARASSYTQIQPHGLIQHHHQHLNLPTHRQPHLHLPQPHTQTLVVQPLNQALSEALKQSPIPSESPKQALASSEAPKQTQALTDAPKQAQASSEAQKQAQVPTEAPKQAQAPTEAQKPSQALSEAQKPAQALPEAQKPAQALPEAQKPAQALPEAQRPGQSLTETEKPGQGTAEAHKPTQASTEALALMDPHTVGLAEAHVQSEPHSLPDAQGRPPPAKGQTMAGPTNPGSVVQAAASTQMPGSGLGLSAGSPVSAGDPHLPLPLKSVVMGIKRKAEDVEEEGEGGGSNLGPPDLIPSHGAGPEAKPAITGKASLHPGPPVLTSVSTLLVGRHGGEKPPRAIVKPHILTHVIEGFVIQEGAEPFPVEATCDQANCKQKAEDPPVLQPETPLSSQHPPSEPVQQGGPETEQAMLTCEFCGQLEQADKFKRSKRFCSMACAKRYNVSCRKGVRRFTVDRAGQVQKETATRLPRRSFRKESVEGTRAGVHKRIVKASEETSRPPEAQGFEETPSPFSPAPGSRQPDRGPCGGGSGPVDVAGGSEISPALWSVQQVRDFITSLPGCQELADEFQLQEIDGQALLLLKEEHLMSTMNMKLGPALKICARINLLKEA